MPFVFTEHGVSMLSSVLNSKRAVQVNISIIRAFVRLREYLSTHKEIAGKMVKMEKKFIEYDKHLVTIYDLIQKLMQKPKEENNRKQIGFKMEK